MHISVAPYNVEITGIRRYAHRSNIELNCASNGGPQLEYRWIFSNNTIGNDTVLNINNATTFNGGNYTCNVTNNAGSDSTMTTIYCKLCNSTYVYSNVVTCVKMNSLYFCVEFFCFMPTVRPYFIIHPVASQEVEVNQEISLTCAAEGFPRPLIQWFINSNGNYNGVTNTAISRDILYSTLNISSATLSDTGIYYCIAMSAEFDVYTWSTISRVTVVGMLALLSYSSSILAIVDKVFHTYFVTFTNMKSFQTK